MISIEPKPVRPRLSWSIWAMLGALMVFVGGLLVLSLSSVYDLGHWDAVTAPSRESSPAGDNGTAELALWAITVAMLAVFGLTIIVVVALTVAMLRGSPGAWGITCAVTCAYLLCCVTGSILGVAGQGDRHDPNAIYAEVTHGPTTPAWVRMTSAGGPYLIVGGAALSTLVLFLPSTRRDLQRRRELPPEEPPSTREEPPSTEERETSA